MKGRGGGGGKKRGANFQKKKMKDNGMLRKYMESVDDFVKNKGGEEEGEGAENDHRLRFVKKKSRRELRKEKRKMKKAKMKSYYEGKNNVAPPEGAAGAGPLKTAVEPKAKDKRQQQEKTKKDLSKKAPQTKSNDARPEKSEDSKTQPTTQKKAKKTNSLLESRKKALLEANKEEEDREIKNMMRCLGYNKGKIKKKLLDCTAIDALDHFLGVSDYESAGAAVLLDNGDDDMDVAKDNLEKLNEGDSDLSGEEEEEEADMTDEDGSADEGGEDGSDLDGETDEEEENADEESGEDDDGSMDEGEEEEAEGEEMEAEDELEEDGAAADLAGGGEGEEDKDVLQAKPANVRSETLLSIY